MRIFANRAERRANIRDWRAWVSIVAAALVGVWLAEHTHLLLAAAGRLLWSR